MQETLLEIFYVIYLVKENLITLSDLNHTIASFSYCEVDKKNKPQVIQTKSLNLLKVKQTAAEMWNFLRLLPFYVAVSIPRSDVCWQNYISFLELLDRLCAPSFSDSDLVVMDFAIKDFFTDYLNLYPDEDLNSKAHFITHYPEMIKKFGPLMKTLRFESKKGQLKDFVKNTKNRKNLCQTIAVKHQMFMYLTYRKTFLLDEKDVYAVRSFEISIKNLPIEEQNCLHKVGNFEREELLTEAKSITIEGQRYSTGEGVVIDYIHDEYVFGMIEKVFIVGGQVYLYCNKVITECYDRHVHAYEICLTEQKMLLQIENLLDYHPLAIYEVNDQHYIVLRYHIPKIL